MIENDNNKIQIKKYNFTRVFNYIQVFFILRCEYIKLYVGNKINKRFIVTGLGGSYLNRKKY